MSKYHIDCENCGAIIKESDKDFTKDILNYTVCDNCESTICINCIGEFNECPVCGDELTHEENF